MMSGAWHSAAFERAKKLPKHEKALGLRASARPQSWQQMKLAAQMWQAVQSAARPAGRPPAASNRVRDRLAARAKGLPLPT